ncbi:uncharacterized protein [Apostichopus japonicus]|uniref:uncharacterized protein isoform X3 n=1 Tax=Stichopus japonicus TaxID=307972 RepID=UPI003AB467B6
MAPPSAEKDKPGKLYLGGLPYEIEEAKLKGHFLKYGKILDVTIIKDKISNSSRGFGFITFESPDDADDAVKGMDRTEIDGKVIKVAHAMKSVHADGQRGERGGSRGGGPSRGTSWGGFSSRGGGGGGGRGRGGGPPMDRGRGRGGVFRGRGGMSRGAPRGASRSSLLGRGGRGDDEYGSERGPLLSTPPETDYGLEEDSMYTRPARVKAPGPRGSRALGYGREDDLDLEARRPTSVYERPSRFDSAVAERSTRAPPSYGRQPTNYDGLPAEREARLPTSYGQEPDGYGSLPSERASRAPLSSYGREPSAYVREASGFGREASSYDRPSSYPTERESAAVSRRSVLDDPYTGRSREPALSDYPASRAASREYPTERATRADLTGDPFSRDPYAPVAREPATAREYGERAREVPSALSHEREPYGSSRVFSTSARETTARPAYPSARGLDTREYERPLSREYPAERNGTYTRERETRDPYGTAGSSRYESYPARDAYASTSRTDKAGYGARDPFGASMGARSARLEAPAPTARSSGYTRR